jgi:hypothetical protein
MNTSGDKNSSQQGPADSATALHGLLNRIECEYNEMPGMCVTRSQAQRLWGLDSATCDVVLTALVENGVLRRTLRGKYIKS